MRKILTAVILGCAMVSLSACNTVQGVGRDIQSVGKAGEKAM